MSTPAEETFLVVVNDEEQYSIWSQTLTMPAGWHATGFSGQKEQCLDHIGQVWTDMRPRSLRVAMDDPGDGQGQGAE
jgi:MbtH protein